MRHRYRFLPEAAGCLEEAAAGNGRATREELAALAESLEACLFADLREEAELLISMLADAGLRSAERIALQRRVLWLLRKYAHRKYRESFEATVGRLHTLLQVRRAEDCRGQDPATQDWEVLARGLPAIEALARARFRG